MFAQRKRGYPFTGRGQQAYLRAVCDDQDIPYTKETTINGLCTLIRSQHPAFTNPAPRDQDIAQTLRSMNSIMDVPNSIRNNASMDHPNADLLEETEAMLVINAARTIGGR